ncbi:MAG: hypothetical protein JNL87_00215 [Burkholderiaceae bacterium]|nr:hypothetical protein [Burkholderiaceae bacterium]
MLPSGSRGFQAAVIGIAVSDRAELVFGPLSGSCKAVDLGANPRIAPMMGWDEGRIARVEGLADEPIGNQRRQLRKVHLHRLPDGHERAAPSARSMHFARLLASTART